MKRIRVGIIGQGRSGRNIHRHLFETQEQLKARFEVVAVADYIPERCEIEGVTPSPEFKKYSDYKEMLKDQSIDLIVNSTR
ncbi:MAG: Gfo/Idh/MocA family oxidoreductase, partial [Lentisphaeria bacterium]|nr:Gfo/Idh/MocA family oxidoreductase [Lentisphaeria bacterium]